MDGVENEFNRIYSSQVDILDVLKIIKSGENLGIVQYGKKLSVERRGILHPKDSILFSLEHVKIQQYEFEFTPLHMNNIGMNAYLQDSYLETSTLLDLTNTSKVSFQVTSAPGSYAANRFKIVFKQKRLPVIHTNLADKGSISKESSITVFPNPVTLKTIQVCFNNKTAGKYKIQLYNQTGQLLLFKTILVQGDYSNHLIKLPLVPAGTYELQFIDAARIQTLQQLIINLKDWN